MDQKQICRPIGKWLIWLAGAAVAVVLVVYGVPMLERLWSGTGEPVKNRQNMLPLPPGGDTAEMLDPLAVAPVETDVDVQEEPFVPEPSEPDVAQAPQDLSPEPDPEEPGQDEAGPDTPAAAVVADEPRSVVADDAPELATITLRFKEDSWVEMESNGRKLVVGIQTAGSERTVRASPPVQLLLGNAPGVELQYRGKAVDLKPHRRGNVARLVLED